MRLLKGFLSFRDHFEFMDDQEIVLFALMLTSKNYAPYQTLCRRGEAPNQVFFVVEGKIAVTALSSKKPFDEDSLKNRILHSEGKFSTLGEASIMFNWSR